MFKFTAMEIIYWETIFKAKEAVEGLGGGSSKLMRIH